MASDKFRSGWWWVPSLYFAEGLPYIVVMALAGIMYTRMDVSNAEMAFYTSWLMLPWLVKPLWSPIVDVISTKRRWVIAMQWLLALARGPGGLACIGCLRVARSGMVQVLHGLLFRDCLPVGYTRYRR